LQTLTGANAGLLVFGNSLTINNGSLSFSGTNSSIILNAGTISGPSLTLAANSISTLANLTTSGPISILTSNLTMSPLCCSFKGSSITITGLPGADLNVNNNTNLVATTGNITISSPAGFNVNISGG